MLEVFNWPAKLKNIETYAFYESGLNNGNLPEGLLSIGDMAFWKTNFTTVTIPASLTSIGDAAFYSTTLEAFEASAASKQYSSHEGLLMDKAKKTILVVPMGKKGHVHLPATLREVGEMAFLNSPIEEVTIPSSVKVLRHGAFEQCANLHTVHFSEGLETVEKNAFRKCSSLNHVLLPASLSSIDGSAFVFCDALDDLRIKDGNKHFSAIDGDIYNAAKTTLVKVASRREGAYTVRDGVTTIGPYAFSSCEHITSVTMPSSVTSLGRGAFIDCVSMSSITLSDQITEFGE